MVVDVAVIVSPQGFRCDRLGHDRSCACDPILEEGEDGRLTKQPDSIAIDLPNSPALL